MQVFEWDTRFSTGREDVGDDPKVWRSINVRAHVEVEGGDDIDRLFRS